MTGQMDCDSLKAILDTFNLVRYVNAVKNSQHVKLEEVQDEIPPLIKLARFLKEWDITLTMAVDLLISFARENISARKTLLCIEYFHQML